MWEIWSKDFHQKRRRNKENHDNNNKEHSEVSKKDWCQRNVINMQEHKDDEEIIETADILNQDEKQ